MFINLARHGMTLMTLSALLFLAQASCKQSSQSSSQPAPVTMKAQQPQAADREADVEETPDYSAPRVIVKETEQPSPEATPAVSVAPAAPAASAAPEVSAPPAAAAENPRPQYRPLAAAQLESLLATIALFPDPLLAQVLPASTYPLEVIEADQWTRDNPEWSARDLDAQPWEECVKALVQYPEVLQMMGKNASWTRSLGLAFLYQQQDVMSAVQRLRSRAVEADNLRDTPEQQVVVVEKEIAILPADPQVICVPSYDPEVIYVRQPVRPRIVFARHCTSEHLLAGFDWARRTVVVGGTWHLGFEMRDHQWVARPMETKKTEVRTWVHDDRKARPELSRVTRNGPPREKTVDHRTGPQQPVVIRQPARKDPVRPEPTVRNDTKPRGDPDVRVTPKPIEQPAARTDPKVREESPRTENKPSLPKSMDPARKPSSEIGRGTDHPTRTPEPKSDVKPKPKSPALDTTPKTLPKTSPEVRQTTPPIKVSEPDKRIPAQTDHNTPPRTQPIAPRSDVKPQPKLPALDTTPKAQPRPGSESRDTKPLPPTTVAKPERTAPTTVDRGDTRLIKPVEMKSLDRKPAEIKPETRPQPPVMDGPKPVAQPKTAPERREMTTPPPTVEHKAGPAEPKRAEPPQPKVETRKADNAAAPKPEPTRETSPRSSPSHDQPTKDSSAPAARDQGRKDGDSNAASTSKPVQKDTDQKSDKRR